MYKMDMEFITRDDFQTHLYSGAIDAISDNNEDMLTEAIATAMAQIAGYLSRYDVDAIFESDDRRKYADLRTFVKDIAKWHFINICNVSADLELAENRYKSAIKELEKIQKGMIVPRGWPLISEAESANSPFSVNSRPKRGNYF